MYKIILSDGSVIDSLQLNGSNFISKKELTEADFKGKLLHYSVVSENETEEHGPAELLHIVQCDKTWKFALHDLTPQEILNQMFTKNQENANAAIRSIMNIMAKFKIPGGKL